MNFKHKGDTPGKQINRSLVWQQHRHLLGGKFKSTAHSFLASRHAGDVECLGAMDVPMDKVWAIESDSSQYQELIKRQDQEGFYVFTLPVEHVANQHVLYSVYLDFCGNLPGSRKVITKVVKRLPFGAVVSVTLFIGREQDGMSSLAQREAALVSLVKKSTPHGCVLVQSVYYLSEDDDVHGSPMGTWTFYLGALRSEGTMKFRLSEQTPEELRQLNPDRLWRAERARAERRSRAAVKANRSRA